MTIINKEFQGRIIGYARVSTRDQNLDMQLDVLQRQDCVQIFCEKISGVKKRPELEHCLSLLREGDVLVVYKLDRLARSLSEIVRICSELESKNIRIRSVKDNIDTTDYMGKFTMHIFAALAEFERKLPIVNLRNEENGDISIRYLAEESSASNSTVVAPRLEDLYLWLFPQEAPERR